MSDEPLRLELSDGTPPAGDPSTLARLVAARQKFRAHARALRLATQAADDTWARTFEQGAPAREFTAASRRAFDALRTYERSLKFYVLAQLAVLDKRVG